MPALLWTALIRPKRDKVFSMAAFDLVVARHVTGDAEMIGAQFGGDAFDTFAVNGHDDDIGARGGVSLGAITPDAAGAAREKNDFIFKQRIHGK